MKKILVLIMTFLLCACSSNALDPNYDDDDASVTSEYISPVNEDVEIFEFLNDDTKNLLYKANSNEDVKTYVLKNLGKELIDGSFVDYNGNTVNLSDYKDSKLVLEIVASWCSHCKDQALKYNDELVNGLDDDIVFIQYFANGDKSSIDSFYSEVGVDVPNNIIVGVNNNDLANALVSSYNLSLTPTFFFFNNGTLTWQRTGTTTLSEFNSLKDVAFNDGLDLSTLTDTDGGSIFNYLRTIEDVKNDLSSENYALLEALDNDTQTIELTLKYIGKDSDYKDQLEDESNFKSEVDFSDYTNKDLIVIFISDDSTIDLINDFNKLGLCDVVVVNTTDENNDTLASKLESKMLSIMNQIPTIFTDINFIYYPSALFIKNGTITGIYSNVLSVDKLSEAYNIFLGDKSIALTANN